MSGPDETRRALLRGAFAVGLAGTAGLSLTACGDGGSAAAQGGPAPDPTTPTTPPTTPSPTGSASRPSAKPKPTKKPKATPAPEPIPSAEATGKATAEATKKPAKPVKLVAKGSPVAAAAEVPVGSGSLYEFQDLIVTQPTAGTFRGFSPLCTHQGCIVDVFEADTMVCTCHDSVFRITDGSVVEGPAKKPMRAKPIVVKDGQIYHAVPE